VSRIVPVLHLPVLRPLASQYALTLCYAVFPVLRLPALSCVRLRLNVRPALVFSLMIFCV